MLGLVKPPCEEASVLAAPERPKQLPRRTWVLIVAILGSSMAFIDGTVVNLALPRIQTDLQATIAQAQWVIEAYTLFLAALIITGGSLGDHRGHRTIFTFGVAVFAIASTACGLASTAGALIGARAVQGVGAALLVPGSLALISSAFPQEERGQAIGIWSAFTSITTAAGPVLAGWFVEHLSWRWVFYINLPTAVVIILLIALKVPECGVRKSEQLDWPGSALTILGFGGIVFGFIQSAPLVGVLGAFALAIFFVVEAQSSQPMLPLRLFRSRNFLGANLLTFFLYAGLSAVTFFLPLDLIQIQGYTPTQAGFALLPFILIVSVLSRWSGKAATKVGSRLLLIVGPAVASLGFALLALAPKGASYGTGLLPAMAFMGLGFAISIAPLTTTVMNALDLNHVGIASGVNNMVSRVAGLLAIAVLGAVMTGTFNGHLDRKLNSLSLSDSTRHQIRSEQAKLAGIETSDPQIRNAIVDAFVSGYRTVVLIAALLGLVSVITAVLFIRNDPSQSAALSDGRRSG